MKMRNVSKPLDAGGESTLIYSRECEPENEGTTHPEGKQGGFEAHCKNVQTSQKGKVSYALKFCDWCPTPASFSAP